CDTRGLPSPTRSVRRRAGPSPPPPAPPHRARRAGAAGATDAQRPGTLSRGARAAREADALGIGRRVALAPGGVRADHPRRAARAPGAAPGGGDLSPGARASLVPVGAGEEGRRDRRGGAVVHRQRVAAAPARADRDRARMTDVYRTPDERFEVLPGYAFEPHYVEQDGLRMHYVDEGDGDP